MKILESRLRKVCSGPKVSTQAPPVEVLELDVSLALALELVGDMVVVLVALLVVPPVVDGSVVVVGAVELAALDVEADKLVALELVEVLVSVSPVGLKHPRTPASGIERARIS
jgi:hypothetical protein